MKLELRGLAKRFGDVPAVDRLSLIVALANVVLVLLARRALGRNPLSPV